MRYGLAVLFFAMCFLPGTVMALAWRDGQFVPLLVGGFGIAVFLTTAIRLIVLDAIEESERAKAAKEEKAVDNSRLEA